MRKIFYTWNDVLDHLNELDWDALNAFAELFLNNPDSTAYEKYLAVRLKSFSKHAELISLDIHCYNYG